MTKTTKTIVITITTLALIIFLVVVLVAQKRMLVGTQIAPSLEVVEKDSQKEEVGIVEEKREEEIVIINNEEWKYDKFGRLAPVKKEVFAPDKNEIIKRIEKQKDVVKIEGEWVVGRRTINTKGEKIIKSEIKKFENNESYEEQLELVKGILGEEDVVYAEPNYIIELDSPIIVDENIIKNLKIVPLEK